MVLGGFIGFRGRILCFRNIIVSPQEQMITVTTTKELSADAGYVTRALALAWGLVELNTIKLFTYHGFFRL